MKHLFTTAALLLAATASVRAEMPTLIYCNGCDDAEESAAAVSAGLGTVYVSDLVAKSVNAYSVFIDVDDSTRPPARIKEASRITPTEPFLTVAKGANAFYNYGAKGWNKSVTLTSSGKFTGLGAADVVSAYPDPNKNVYDFIDPGPTQNSLISWTKNGTSQVMNRIAIGLIDIAATFHIVDSAAVPKLKIEVDFSDGSHISIDADFSTTNALFTVDPKSGLDSHGNNVPATKEAATCSTNGVHGICRFNFDGPGNPSDRGDWENRMWMLGVQVDSGSSGGGSSGHGTWACVKSGDGADAVYTCEFIH